VDIEVTKEEAGRKHGSTAYFGAISGGIIEKTTGALALRWL
jgi:hypothetical protein